MSEWIVFAETVDDFVDGMFSIVNKIVRCEDCKWQSTVHDADDNSNYYMCGVHAQPTDPYAFCSYGERRSE